MVEEVFKNESTDKQNHAITVSGMATPTRSILDMIMSDEPHQNVQLCQQLKQAKSKRNQLQKHAENEISTIQITKQEKEE